MRGGHKGSVDLPQNSGEVAKLGLHPSPIHSGELRIRKVLARGVDELGSGLVEGTARECLFGDDTADSVAERDRSTVPSPTDSEIYPVLAEREQRGREIGLFMREGGYAWRRGGAP